METAQIKFYPLRNCVRFPTYSEQVYFHELQLELCENTRKIESEQDKYEKAVMKQSYHKWMRKKMYIVKE